ncbi:hypothetical protein vseg_014840 [Gypsophila vaccaria]
MEEKQLIIVVEGTGAMGPHWKSIVSDYLVKIVRAFCAKDKTSEKSTTSGASDSTFALALVVFNTRGPYSAFLVRRSGWTRDEEIFLSWLSNLSLSGGGFEDVATTDGLADALMMFAIPENGYQAAQNVDGTRHCVLVSASNPYPLPTPVYKPKIEELELDENGEAQMNLFAYDAETVAKWFGQCSVSLSVISPRQLPKLRAIYNAAKRSQTTSEPAVVVKQPHFLVLISDSFVEACAALSQLSTPPENASTLNKPLISTGNAPQSDIRKEPSTETSTGAVSAQPLMPSMPRYGFPSAPSSQTSSPTVSQDIITKTESLPGIKPIIGISQSLQPSGVVANITNSIQSTPGSTSLAQGIPQLAQGMQSVGMNSSASTTPTSQQGSSSLSSQQAKYCKVWEGNLIVKKPGQVVIITKLEGYRPTTVSETIAADWPPDMPVARLIPLDHMNSPQYAGKGDFLVFRAMNQHAFLSQLQEKKLCAVIPLPSQTLLLSMSDKPCRLIGMIFPRDLVVLEPQLPEEESIRKIQQHLKQQIQQLRQQQQQPQQTRQQSPQQRQ